MRMTGVVYLFLSIVLGDLSDGFLSVHDIHALWQRVHGIGRAHAAAVEVVDGPGSRAGHVGRGYCVAGELAALFVPLLMEFLR